jgi:hypothetical protein
LRNIGLLPLLRSCRVGSEVLEVDVAITNAFFAALLAGIVVESSFAIYGKGANFSKERR